MLFVLQKGANYTKKRYDCCKQGNTLKGRLFAGYLKKGVFQVGFVGLYILKK